MTDDRVTRRGFLRVSGMAAAVALTAGCAATPAAGPTTEPAPTEAPTQAPAATPEAATPAPTTAAEAAPSTYGEAPMLAARVQAGELPPVDERLPTEPKVIDVVEEIGQYGGVWHRAAVGVSDTRVIGFRLAYAHLVQWTPDTSGVVPNIARDYEISEDGTEFTFYLREGMRWSDGSPYTADDYVFYYEDWLGNTDLYPTFPKNLSDPATSQPVTLEKVDDYTIRLKFASPYGLFINWLAGQNGRTATPDAPAAYLKQFHPEYADADELDQMTRDAGYDNWYQLFAAKADWHNPECPRVWPWVFTRVPPDVPVVAERNPYFWKVDPEGNQLPYIDSIQMEMLENADLVNLKAMAGEIDMQFRHILWSNYPLFVENAEQGEYRVLQWQLDEGSNFSLQPNVTHVDPVLAALMQQRDFRAAMSLGTNREELKELAYVGFGTPRQATVLPACPYFREEFATAYTEYDPDTANQLLDGIGLTERDAEGYRLRPDGEPLTLTIEYSPIFGPWRDAVQLISEQWQEIGLRVAPREEDRQLYQQRGLAREVDIGCWATEAGFTPFTAPQWYMPWGGGGVLVGGVAWYDWYNTGGQSGEEPNEEAQAQYDMLDRIKAALPADLPALADEFFTIASENVWYIGTIGELPAVVIVKNNFRNVPETALCGAELLSPANTNLEQYFIRQS